MKTATRLLSLLLVLGALTGCAVAVGAAAGVGTYKYIENKSTQDYRASLRATYDATLAALPELGYPAATTAQLGPTEAKVKAGKATVTMASFPNAMTRVAVSVGTFEGADNRRRAALIQEALAKRLGPPVVPAQSSRK